MDIEQIDFSSIDPCKKSWSAPFNFRIKKDDNSFKLAEKYLYSEFSIIFVISSSVRAPFFWVIADIHSVFGRGSLSSIQLEGQALTQAPQ